MSTGTGTSTEGTVAEIFLGTVESILKESRKAPNPHLMIQTVDLQIEFKKVSVSKKGLWFSNQSSEQGITIQLSTRIHLADSL